MTIRRHWRGFTIIELMVILAVLAIVLSLIGPGMLQRIEAARQMKCADNLKQLGLALHNYHDVHTLFPPSSINPGAVNSDSFIKPGCVRNTTGYLFLLPFLGSDALARYKTIDFHLATGNADWHDLGRTAQIAPSEPFQRPLDVLRCPSDEPHDEPHAYEPQNMYTIENAWRVSYGFVSHATEFSMGLHQPRGGAIFGSYNRATRIADVRDGTSNTLALIETPFKKSNPAFGPFFHAYVHSHYLVPTEFGINQPYAQVDNEWVPYAWGAGSRHEGNGCNVLMADGRVRFLGENISQTILSRLVMMNDAAEPFPNEQKVTDLLRRVENTPGFERKQQKIPPQLADETGSGRKPHASKFSSVTGTVVMDGEPLANAAVLFMAMDFRPAIGVTDAEGRYVLRYNKTTPGVPMGVCQVQISQSGKDFAQGNAERIPAKYNAQSELTVEVVSGDNVFDFDLRSK